MNPAYWTGCFCVFGSCWFLVFIFFWWVERDRQAQKVTTKRHTKKRAAAFFWWDKAIYIMYETHGLCRDRACLRNRLFRYLESSHTQQPVRVSSHHRTSTEAPVYGHTRFGQTGMRTNRQRAHSEQAIEKNRKHTNHSNPALERARRYVWPAW